MRGLRLLGWFQSVAVGPVQEERKGRFEEDLELSGGTQRPPAWPPAKQ